MEERYALAEGKGRLTVRAAEGRVACEAMLPDDGRGLYKAYLSGPQGRFPLGALLPEGGTLVLRRTLSVGELERRGVWPPTGGGVELAYPAQRHPAAPPAPPGWVREAQPGRLMGEMLLARCAGAAEGALLRREEDGFSLALPFRTDRRFPQTPLFCFAKVENLGEEHYAIFCFNRCGCPRPPHKGETQG